MFNKRKKIKNLKSNEQIVNSLKNTPCISLGCGTIQLPTPERRPQMLWYSQDTKEPPSLNQYWDCWMCNIRDIRPEVRRNERIQIIRDYLKYEDKDARFSITDIQRWRYDDYYAVVRLGDNTEFYNNLPYSIDDAKNFLIDAFSNQKDGADNFKRMCEELIQQIVSTNITFDWQDIPTNIKNTFYDYDFDY